MPATTEPISEGRKLVQDAMAEAFGPKSAGEKAVLQTVTPSQEPPAKAAVPSGDGSQLKALVEQEKPTPEKQTEKETATTEETSEQTEQTTDDQQDNTEQPEDKGPSDEKGRYRWGELKKENKTQKARIQELESEIAKRSEDSVEKTRLSEERDVLKRQLEEAQKELYVHRIEATPQWREKIAEPTQKVLDTIEFLAQRHSLDANKIADAIYDDSHGKTGPLEELISGLSTREQQRYYNLSEDVINIESRKADLKRDSKAAYDTFMREQQEKEGKMREATLKTFQTASEHIGSKVQETLKDVLPDDIKIDYPALKLAATQVDTWTPEERVLAGYMASVGPELIQAVRAWSDRAKKAEAENVKLRGASPKSNSSGSSPTAPSQAKKQESREELASKSWEQLAGESVSRIFAGRT